MRAGRPLVQDQDGVSFFWGGEGPGRLISLGRVQAKEPEQTGRLRAQPLINTVPPEPCLRRLTQGYQSLP